MPLPTISLQLEVKPNNKVLVPGCEPSSDLTSKVLAMYLAKGGCGAALVDLEVALAAIPGSTVKWGDNYNRGGFTQRWLVLPPIPHDCPCMSYPDYFAILKTLAQTELPVQEKFDTCDVEGMGYCPSPDFEMAEAPPVDPYQPEGATPAGGGILPPVPPWALDLPGVA